MEGQYSEFPNADNITRRLKKLVQFVAKEEYSQSRTFDVIQTAQEPTGLSIQEKNILCDTLINHGLPLTSEGKSDIAFLRTKLNPVTPPMNPKASKRAEGEGEDSAKEAEKLVL